MSLGVQLGNRSGFYGAEVTFPEGSPQVFTVVFILTNSLLTETTIGFDLDFPAYPSFTKDAARCNVSIVLPEGAALLNVTKEDGIVFTNNFGKDNLAAFTYSTAIAGLSVLEGWIQQINVEALDRVVTLGPAGEVAVSDNYHIVNTSPKQLVNLKLDVPIEASTVAASDEFDRALTVEVLSESSNGVIAPANVTLTSSLKSGQSASVSVSYSLPSMSSGQTPFALKLDLFPYFNYYVNEASVAIIPPEGAHIATPQLTSADPSLSLERELFQETLKITREGVSYIDRDVPVENALQIAYEYNPLWLSLRPTLWVWALAIVGSVILAVWRRPKSFTPPRIVVPRLSAGLNPDNLRAFTEAYEERAKIRSELKLLIARAQKGKIPRRQYKVQRRTFELRFDALSKNIAELKATFRSAGGNYANLVRQLDEAEAELNKAEMSIMSAERRHATGELPVEEYKKSIADFQKRKEKAETTINGILLRIREEIR
jgi:hypothetical protein